jgi:hypothetical protein
VDLGKALAHPAAINQPTMAVSAVRRLKEAAISVLLRRFINSVRTAAFAKTRFHIDLWL